jgi:hypothetical protein
MIRAGIRVGPMAAARRAGQPELMRFADDHWRHISPAYGHPPTANRQRAAATWRGRLRRLANDDPLPGEPR